MAKIGSSGHHFGPEWDALGRDIHFRVLHSYINEFEIDLGPEIELFSFFKNCEGIRQSLSAVQSKNRSGYYRPLKIASVEIPFFRAEIFISDGQFSEIVAERYLAGWNHFCEYAKRKKMRIKRDQMDEVLSACLDKYLTANVQSSLKDHEARFYDLMFQLDDMM